MSSGKVLCVSDELCLGSTADSQCSFVKLKKPNTDEAALYGFSPDGKTVFELTEHTPEFGCWFVDDEILSDGRLIYVTKIDPIFLILSYLQHQTSGVAQRYIPLDQIIEDEIFPHTNMLMKTDGIQYLKVLTDSQDLDDITVYRYNHDKTLKWLSKKVSILTYDLSQHDEIQVHEGAQSADFIRSKQERTDPEVVKDYACNIVSQYISKSLKDELRCHLGLPDKMINKLPETTEQPQNKKSKSSGPLEDYTKGFNVKAKSDQKMTPLAKKLAKIDKTGMKSITSFFKPKKSK